MPGSQWDQRERVLLEAIAASEQGGQSPDTNALVGATGLDRLDVNRALHRLVDGEYIAGHDAATFGNPDALIGIRLRERGLREIGEWPSDTGYDALIQTLDQHIEAAGNSEDRSRLERLRDGVIGVGRDVLTSVLAEAIKKAGGLS